MRAVLYADDMEPITVLDIPTAAWNYLIRDGRAHLVVPEPVRLVAKDDSFKPWQCCVREVTLKLEWMYRRGEKHPMIFASPEENVLMLKAAFLPGQVATVQGREDDAFARGFLRALTMIGG